MLRRMFFILTCFLNDLFSVYSEHNIVNQRNSEEEIKHFKSGRFEHSSFRWNALCKMVKRIMPMVTCKKREFNAISFHINTRRSSVKKNMKGFYCFMTRNIRCISGSNQESPVICGASIRVVADRRLFFI
jgi:hypothetical protein